VQVHVNGFVSLDTPLYPSWYPYLYQFYGFYGFTQPAVVAPFWADIDLSYGDGVVYLGHVSRYSAAEFVSTQAAEVFDAAKSLVLIGAGDTGFLPTEVVTVTWQDVSPAWYWDSLQVRAIDASLHIGSPPQISYFIFSFYARWHSIPSSNAQRTLAAVCLSVRHTPEGLPRVDKMNVESFGFRHREAQGL